MSMHNPSHPGQIVRSSIDALDLSVTAAADILDVSRQALSNLLNGHASMSSDMTVRLEKAFGSTAETWLKLQMNYDCLAGPQKRIENQSQAL